jgi:hypothetical protein
MYQAKCNSQKKEKNKQEAKLAARKGRIFQNDGAKPRKCDRNIRHPEANNSTKEPTPCT